MTFLGSPNCNTIACLVSFTIKKAPVKVRNPINIRRTIMIFLGVNFINYYFPSLSRLEVDKALHLVLQHHLR